MDLDAQRADVDLAPRAAARRAAAAAHLARPAQRPAGVVEDLEVVERAVRRGRGADVAADGVVRVLGAFAAGGFGPVAGRGPSLLRLLVLLLWRWRRSVRVRVRGVAVQVVQLVRVLVRLALAVVRDCLHEQAPAAGAARRGGVLGGGGAAGLGRGAGGADTGLFVLRCRTRLGREVLGDATLSSGGDEAAGAVADGVGAGGERGCDERRVGRGGRGTGGGRHEWAVGMLLALGGRRGREEVAVDGRLGLLTGAGDEVGADEVGGGEGNLVEGPGLANGLVALDLRASEAGGRIARVDRRDQPRFTEVVFRFEVLDFGAVGPVDDADGDGENGVAL